MPGKLQREELRDLLSLQETERELPADAPGVTFESDRPERVTREQELRWTKGGKDQDLGRSHPGRHIGQEVYGRGIRPVDVVEEQHQRAKPRHLVKEGVQLPLQPFL